MSLVPFVAKEELRSGLPISIPAKGLLLLLLPLQWPPKHQRWYQRISNGPFFALSALTARSTAGFGHLGQIDGGPPRTTLNIVFAPAEGR